MTRRRDAALISTTRRGDKVPIGVGASRFVDRHVRSELRDGRAYLGGEQSRFHGQKNLLTAGIALTAASGDLTLKFGAFRIGGIGTATFGAIILYQILARTFRKE
jgi:hypothetical protein